MPHDGCQQLLIMANSYQRWEASTPRVLAAVCVLIAGCTAGGLSDDHNPRLARLDERVVKGLGMVLYAPEPLRFGPQRVVVALTAGSRIEMSNLSAVWVTYRSPSGGVEQTVSMLPVADYMDAFGAVIPFTETGLWNVSIQVYRVGSMPATSNFSLLCCAESAGSLTTRFARNGLAVAATIHSYTSVERS